MVKSCVETVMQWPEEIQPWLGCGPSDKLSAHGFCFLQHIRQGEDKRFRVQVLLWVESFYKELLYSFCSL